MSHYFDEAPATPSATTSIIVNTPGARFEMRTDRGVFSHGRLDAGTAVLLRHAPALPTTGTFLDLGSGAGPIALTMATRSPAASVWAIDTNERARDLTRANAAALGLDQVSVAAPDELPADVRFDIIWSNPPIRVGKAVLHDLLMAWLLRLAPDGHACLVVHKHLGSDSLHRWLTEQGFPTARHHSAGGYRLLWVAAATGA